jgi:hypothetical protein
MNKKFLFTTVCFLTTIGSLVGQDRFRVALDSLQKYPEEKIYLLYDKSQYLAGETIWFSAFIFSGNQLSAISTNLFVELYDSKKNLIARQLIPVFNGQATGQVSLSDKLEENIYFIRAYTRWMLNFPEDCQYVHPLKILNPRSQKELHPQQVPWKAEAYPEGGNLIDGVDCKIAVRLYSPSPLPAKWKGYISDVVRNEKLASFNSIDPNVATVMITPSAGHQYRLTVQDETGVEQNINLPTVASSGVHLEVENFNDSIIYLLNFKNVGNQKYKLIGTLNNDLVYEAEINNTDSLVTRFIRVSDFTNGILRLSLFDSQDHVIAERLCFVKPSSLAIKAPLFFKESLNDQPRGQNLLELKCDTIQNPLSILILDPDAKDPAEDNNLLSTLWLTNDLSNPIENPFRYFYHTSSSTEDALDAILVSETWKGFSWDQILHDRYPVIKFMPDDYIAYKGVVFRNKKLLVNEKVNCLLAFPDSSRQIVEGETDSTGSFIFSHLLFYDSVKISYGLNTKKAFGKNITIQFESLNEPIEYRQPFPAVPYSLGDAITNDTLPKTIGRAANTLINEQLADTKYKTLEEVKVKTTIKSATEKLESDLSHVFAEFDKFVFDFVNEDQHADGYENILEWLQGRVPGLWVYRAGGGDLILSMRDKPVPIYLDEFPTDTRRLDGYPVSDIAMIKVIKGFYAGTGFVGHGKDGAIFIYSRRGDMRSANLDPSLNIGTLRGYAKAKEFPMPEYDEAIYPEIKSDTRDVLFWNASAFAKNSESEIPIRFYNNDSAKQFRVIIMGVGADGSPVYYDEVIK